MSQDFQIIMFYIPCPSMAFASNIGRAAISEKLAACYNLIPINSYYPWEGAMVSDQEITLILKTTEALELKLSAFIEKEHEYNTPCIARWKANVNKSYYEWVDKITSKC